MSAVAPPASAPASRAPRFTSRRLIAALSHGYIWIILGLFVLPFLTLLLHSFDARGGTARARELPGGVSVVR